MQITIDNLDGRGAGNYTDAVVPEGPITITRVLNEPSTCTVELAPEAVGLPMPGRRARVVVMTDDASTLFTGYLPVEPVRVYVGQTSTGVAYKVRLAAVSDEWLLDKLGPGAATSGMALDAGEFIRQLTNKVSEGSNVLAVETANTLRLTGAVASKADGVWSVNAKLAANAGYAGYRVLGGQIAVQSAPTVTHALSDGDAVLDPRRLSFKAMRELANDVTVSGAEEPAAYITETFEANGTTAQFMLNDSAFRFAQQTVLRDGFEDAVLNAARWNVSDPGGNLALGEDGLTFNGGSGADGRTMLTALQAIEMGGTLTAELNGVLLLRGSNGMLAGFYTGQPVLANCFAGIRVRQDPNASGSQIVLAAIANGAEIGTPSTVLEGHAYTLRVRLHGAEVYRVAQRYYCMTNGVVQGFTGTAAAEASMHALVEIVDEASPSTPATVLFDSAAAKTEIPGVPVLCNFVVVNAIQMFGSVRGIRVDQPGSAWVISTLPGGDKYTRLTGSTGERVDCEVAYGSQAGTPGNVTFLADRVPVQGERVTVFYRGQRRAVARISDAASIASEPVGTEPGVSRWLGKVLQPPARTSADCESAAQAVLAMATSRTAAMAGRYEWVNPRGDIWPGDLLEATDQGVALALLVRRVVITDGCAAPEVRVYEIGFANDWATEWAEGFGIRLSSKIAEDAVLPDQALNSPGEVLANLPNLAITVLSASALGIDAGTVPPAGGGFEVRRRDWAFGPGNGGTDLVLRSPVRIFSIPRAAQSDRFYVRMYDGSTPPVYSRLSSALFVHPPVP